MSSPKYEKLLTDTYVSDRIHITEDEATKELTECSFVIKNTLKDKEADTELNSAKVIVKDLSAGYTAAINYEKAKIDFLLEKIEEARLAKSKQ